MRTNRTKPKYSISTRCYRHPKCSHVKTLIDAPTDEELIEWVHSVQPSTIWSSKEVDTRLLKKHTDKLIALVDKKKAERESVAAG